MGRVRAGVLASPAALESCRADNFADFIRLCLDREPGYVSRMYEWYIGPPGQQFVNFVGRYESLVNDLVRVLTILEQPFDEAALRSQDRVNASRQLHGEPVWAPDLKRQVLALEAPAIRRYYPQLASSAIRHDPGHDRPVSRFRGLLGRARASFVRPGDRSRGE